MTSTTYRTFVNADIPDKHNEIRLHKATPSFELLTHFNIERVCFDDRNVLKSCTNNTTYC